MTPCCPSLTFKTTKYDKLHMRTSKFCRGYFMGNSSDSEHGEQREPAREKSGRPEIDDLPEKSHLGKSEINNDKQELDKGS